LLGARLVDTLELGVSPILLGRPGVPMMAREVPLPTPVTLALTHQQAYPSGMLVLEYSVRYGAHS
jgi:hypothetical protein